MRPASLPTAYPAEKLSALKTTTTPALTTQVSSVGDTNSSSALYAVDVARRFFTARRSLDALRLAGLRLLSFAAVRPSADAEAEVEVDVRRIVGWKVGSGTVGGERGRAPGSADSGTRRSVLGSMRVFGRGGACVGCGFGLERLRAAAA